MRLNKVEKITFATLTISLAFGLMLLTVKLSNINSSNKTILKQINSVSQYTDKTDIEKTFYFNESESFNKLNLNRTNLESIKLIPCLNAPLAKRIYEFIQSKKKIYELSELLEVKGMSRKKLKELDKYATVMGGHAGSAAWGDKINLNFTNENELSNLPGLSKKMAEKIINFRNANGGFQSLDDLYEIPGLSDKTIKKFIDKVEVR